MNSGGSVKDRAALGIILAAESEGRLRPGDTIVEGTAGNTGIGLTVVGLAKGYRTVIVIPETQTQSPEKNKPSQDSWSERPNRQIRYCLSLVVKTKSIIVDRY
jgi:hypothetical protein